MIPFRCRYCQVEIYLLKGRRAESPLHTYTKYHNTTHAQHAHIGAAKGEVHKDWGLHARVGSHSLATCSRMPKHTVLTPRAGGARWAVTDDLE